MSIRNKAWNGVYWNVIESLFGQGIQFFIGIILARILSPKEFGIIGIITIFITIAESLVNSGFYSSLIRKKDCTEDDYSTVFFFNAILGIILTSTIFFISPFISHYFEDDALYRPTQVLSIIILLNSLSIVHRAKLTKNLSFNKISIITITSSLVSGLIALYYAYNNWGIWSLVFLQLSKSITSNILFWILDKWKPKMVFSRDSFRDLFGFGSKILIGNIIDNLFRNLYYFVIGKFISTTELGYYTRADLFKTIASNNITDITTKVSYPILSEIQNENDKLKSAYREIIILTFYIVSNVMVILLCYARPIVLSVLGSKWEPSVIYLQLLCIIGIIYPIKKLNANVLYVKGFSGISLKIEIIQKIILITSLFFTIKFGVISMIIALIITNLIELTLFSLYTRKILKYKLIEQFNDVKDTLGLIIILLVIYSFINYVCQTESLITLGFILIGSLFTSILFSYFSNNNGFKILFNQIMHIKELICNRIK